MSEVGQSGQSDLEHIDVGWVGSDQTAGRPPPRPAPCSNRCRPRSVEDARRPRWPWHVVAVLPKGPLAMLALVGLLPGAAGQQLNRLDDPIATNAVVDQEMHVLGGHPLIQDRKPIPPLGLIEPLCSQRPRSRANLSRNSRLWQGWVRCQTCPGINCRCARAARGIPITAFSGPK